MKKSDILLEVKGKKCMSRKLETIWRVNRVLFWCIIVYLMYTVPFPISEPYIDMYLSVLFLLLVVKIIVMILRAKELTELSTSENPNHLRFYIGKRVKSGREIQELLSLFYYFILTHDIENCERVLEEINSKNIGEHKRPTRIIPKRPFIRLNLFEYYNNCFIYSFSRVDIVSLLELRQLSNELMLKEEKRETIRKEIGLGIKVFKGDLEMKKAIIDAINQVDRSLHRYFLCIINCVNDEKEEFEINRNILLQGSPETFYYKVLERNTMESLLAIINDSKSKVDSSIWE